MKITNNEIVVKLPEQFKDKSYSVYPNYNKAVNDIKKLNPPLVVDVEALATLIGDSDYSYDGNSEKLAQHLASNLDKWLLERKSSVKGGDHNGR